MADAASRLTHLPDRQFISHFLTNFPQSKPWSLPPLPPRCKQQLTTMMQNKQPPRSSMPPYSRKTPPPGANGRASAAGSNFTLNSSTLMTPFPSSIFSPSASVPSFCPCKVNLSRSDRLRNTSAQLVKSLHPWGPTTPGAISWGRSTFGWDTSWRPIRGSIILQQECGPSLSALSNPWTMPPREPPQ